MLAVVIVSWNVRELLRPVSLRCGRTWPKARPGARVVVVDNASTDGSAEMVRAEFADTVLIASHHNLGYVKANNLAMRHLGLDKAAPNVEDRRHTSGC
jgi:N-acetylglucosaminyl-diphospho-decaprenol L-rhamnosyltransferase